MDNDRIARRLVAILAIDMVGYSRHMEVDESATIARLRHHRQEIMQPIISGRDGRIVKTTGDGLLVEFGSVVDAVESAVLIQRAVAEAESGMARERRIQYRAGINIGDIVVDGDDIFGDGVNIAARMEALADPGGVSLTSSVFEQVAGKVAFAFEDLGECQVKNIKKRIRVYRVVLEIIAEQPRDDITRPAAPKPAIAVLPFQDMSADRDQEYFADGIAEDIITGLARHQGFLVIARNSSFTYKGAPVDIKQVAGELGVRYVLEGSVRRGGNRVRITAQLIDAGSGSHIWAEQFDRQIDDLFEVQDDITASIVGVVAPELIGAEMQRARQKDSASLNAWDCVMRANWHAWRLTKSDCAQAKAFAHKALTADPNLARAYVVVAMCCIDEVLYAWTNDPAATLGDAHGMARKAVELDDRDAEAHMILGSVALFMRRFEDSGRSLDTAIGLNPNLASARMWGGGYYALTGDIEQARHALKLALRLSPRDPANYWTFGFFGMAEFVGGNYDAAIEWARKALHLKPHFPTACRVLLASYGELGQREKASEALRHLMSFAPETTIESTRASVPWKHQEHAERYLAALRKGGLPEASQSH
ncbi:adenylate/guanylate cyclase domain-containing protein [Phyllobacterium sp. 0TCS1.6C]|uniref:adenylate/guanylate cyclase domain-containing protein n=1 Tax=unclassified Phyllobacterium TaxID=2638441 RepID=UPI0022655C1F|nr:MULTISPECIES: adenylate/guanylate cyclase domain-containing protein [unclassified Phyllobacterium]MCX8279774.1 adenylate/guanylate cyclase domain-containing protein [Phyllobacterium sp. 0TCS1.6C]MCX8295622.1 adenylate/guanylate cyclase domain-containing protein [Phyllobacterium sp. 0TCS1.6A]